MESLHIGHDGRVGRQGEVDTRVGNQIGLELCEVHVEGPVKTEWGGDGRYNLMEWIMEMEWASEYITEMKWIY